MSNGAQSRPAVLVVDDDPFICELLAEILGDAGFGATCMGSGRAALAALAQEYFDLLILDQWLPDLNGLAICEAARRWYGDAPGILILTADQRIERWTTALELGADDCIGKPFHVDVLLARIAAKLRRVEHRGAAMALALGR